MSRKIVPRPSPNPDPGPILLPMTFTTRRIREEKPSRWKALAAKAAPYVLRFGGLFVGLYGKWKIRHEEEETHAHRVRILKKTAVVLASVLFGMVILAGTVKALVAMRILTIHNFLSVAGSELPADENGFTNFLLLGVGDKTHEGVDLTDTIMIVSLDPWKTRSAVMLSLPRDLYVLKTENMGRGRVNELYRNYKIKLKRDGMTASDASIGAMKELTRELGNHLGITLHHVMKVDFTAFVEGVDALGGVDIVVPEDIVDTEYPGPDYSFQTFEIRQGLQHLDGETALKYARSRHTTSDFSRAARQQQLVQALAEKARTMGITDSPGTITSLLKILSDHVETTMTFADILGAARLGEQIERANVISHTLGIASGINTGIATPGGFLYPPPRDQFDGASVLLPFSIPESPVTWKQIQTFLRFLTMNRTILLSNPSIQILNAGAPTGTARILASELVRYGLPDVETDNATEDRKNPLKLPATVIVPLTPEDRALSEFFSTLLHLPTGPLPPGIDPLKQRQVTIVLGMDYEYRPFQDLIPLPVKKQEAASSLSQSTASSALNGQ